MSDFSSGVSTVPSLMWSFLLHWAMLVSLHKYVYVVLAGFNYWLLYLMLVRWWWNYLLNTMFYLISITSTLTLDENLVEHLISQRILTVVPTIASPKELLGDFFFFFDLFWFFFVAHLHKAELSCAGSFITLLCLNSYWVPSCVRVNEAFAFF